MLVPLKRGRRPLFRFPIHYSVNLEGNRNVAIEDAIARRVGGVRSKNDLVVAAVDLWLSTNGVPVPPLEAGSVFYEEKGGDARAVSKAKSSTPKRLSKSKSTK